jgi:hypothetical protein
VRKLGRVIFLQLGYSLPQARVITRDEDVIPVVRARPLGVCDCDFQRRLRGSREVE